MYFKNDVQSSWINNVIFLKTEGKCGYTFEKRDEEQFLKPFTVIILLFKKNILL